MLPGILRLAKKSMHNNCKLLGARTLPVEKTLKRYNEYIPLLIFSVIPLMWGSTRPVEKSIPLLMFSIISLHN